MFHFFYHWITCNKIGTLNKTNLSEFFDDGTIKVDAVGEKNKIVFEEKLQQGVFRGMKNRLNWLKKWEALMNQPIKKTPLKKESFIWMF